MSNRKGDGSLVNGRDLARKVLTRIRRDGAYANLALSAALERAGSVLAGERSLATEIVYGVLRHQRRLDHALGCHTRRPLRKVDADLRDLLRVAAYQILMLDRVPSHAVVDHAVGSARRLRGQRVAGFVNAILRKLDSADLTADLPEDPVARLALTCSLPDDLARYWIEQLGVGEARALGEALLERAPLTARANTLRAEPGRMGEILEAEGGTVERGALCPTAWKVKGLPRPFSSPSYGGGIWTAQDEAAQLVTEALAPRAGELIVDACSGVGGKSTHMAAKMANQGRIICLDVNGVKLRLLREHCSRLGVRICHPVRVDLAIADPPIAAVVADRVLLDAPCSGLGVIRRHPEIKWRERPPKQRRELVELQRRLFTSALSLLRPGGVLVYSVCTTTEEEGPEQVDWALSRFPELRPMPMVEGPLAPLSDAGRVTLWPHRHGTDGFFIARFRCT